jgi:hypothetical protein
VCLDSRGRIDRRCGFLGVQALGWESRYGDTRSMMLVGFEFGGQRDANNAAAKAIDHIEMERRAVPFGVCGKCTAVDATVAHR